MEAKGDNSPGQGGQGTSPLSKQGETNRIGSIT